METRGATGVYHKASDTYTLYVCSQGAESLRDLNAAVMGVPNEKLARDHPGYRRRLRHANRLPGASGAVGGCLSTRPAGALAVDALGGFVTDTQTR